MSLITLMFALRNPVTRAQPRAYRGLNHETIGSDIIAVARTLSLPSLTLGADLFAEILTVEPNQWYPIGILLRAMDRLATRMSREQLRYLGRLIFRHSHSEAPLPPTVRDLVYGFDKIYRNANRGEGIGGWAVQSFGATEAVLEKTTPGVCAIEEGIWAEVLEAMHVPARITQSQCVFKGGASCVFHVHAVDGARFTGV